MRPLAAEWSAVGRIVSAQAVRAEASMPRRSEMAE